MATYTPNFNLYKPDATDDYKDFRAEHNNNMDIIDQNLGGGSRHTIVDENGTDMPNEARLQFTGDVTVTDDNVNGVTVVDVPVRELVITNETLTFSNNVAFISNPLIDYSSLAFVFYHDPDVAEAAGITAQTLSGVPSGMVYFTATTTPASPVTVDVIIKL